MFVALAGAKLFYLPDYAPMYAPLLHWMGLLGAIAGRRAQAVVYGIVASFLRLPPADVLVGTVRLSGYPGAVEVCFPISLGKSVFSGFG